MTELFSERLKKWRGKLYQKEAAAKLDVPLPTFRKWESGKRTPGKLTLAEVIRRMEKSA
jgi:DNA-binding transcriptional regulator YiaG